MSPQTEQLCLTVGSDECSVKDLRPSRKRILINQLLSEQHPTCMLYEGTRFFGKIPNDDVTEDFITNIKCADLSL